MVIACRELAHRHFNRKRHCPFHSCGHSDFVCAVSSDVVVGELADAKSVAVGAFVPFYGTYRIAAIRQEPVSNEFDVIVVVKSGRWDKDVIDRDLLPLWRTGRKGLSGIEK